MNKTVDITVKTARTTASHETSAPMYAGMLEMRSLSHAFNFMGKGAIRVLAEEGNVWFAAKDVCRILGYRDHKKAVKRHVRADEWTKRPLEDTIGRKQRTIVVNESGIYSLIFGSQMPDAEAFRHYVTAVILPSIRCYGAYLDPGVLEKAQADPKSLRELVLSLGMANEKLMCQKAAAEDALAQAAPRIALADSLMAAKNAGISISAMAKILRQQGHRIGRNSLFKWLRGQGMLISQKRNWNEPAQWVLDAGLMAIVELHIHGSVFTVPRITGKGQVYLLEQFNAKAKRPC